MYTCKHERTHSVYMYILLTQNSKTEVTNVYFEHFKHTFGCCFFILQYPLGLEICNFCFPKCRDLTFGHGYDQC